MLDCRFNYYTTPLAAIPDGDEVYPAFYNDEVELWWVDGRLHGVVRTPQGYRGTTVSEMSKAMEQLPDDRVDLCNIVKSPELLKAISVWLQRVIDEWSMDLGGVVGGENGEETTD